MGPEHPHPQLAPPGAGLPWWQALLGRYVLLPGTVRTHGWDRACRLFQREGRRVLGLATPLSLAELNRPILVRGVIGIEDSSRYWSVTRVLEHMIIVGDRMGDIIVALTHGRTPAVSVDIADVKPPGALPAENARETFCRFLSRHDRRCRTGIGPPGAPGRWYHPWFGEINAHQWLCLSALHQRIHRHQIEAITRGLCGRRRPRFR